MCVSIYIERVRERTYKQTKPISRFMYITYFQIKKKSVLNKLTFGMKLL